MLLAHVVTYKLQSKHTCCMILCTHEKKIPPPITNHITVFITTITHTVINFKTIIIIIIGDLVVLYLLKAMVP